MTTFNEYRKQQEQLRENSLYTDPASKQSFMDDEKSIMAAFMFNFFGLLIGYNIIKDKQRVKTYFKSDLKMQLNNITDDNNNISLIIKIMDEKGAFKSAQTSAQITRFLVKLKQGGIDEVQPDILIEWMNGIKDSWWSKLNSHLKVTKEEFIVDKDQYKAFMNLRVRARVQTDVSKDFFDAFRGLNVEKSKITAWDVDMMSKKSIDARLAKVGAVSSTSNVAKPAPQPTTYHAPEPVKQQSVRKVPIVKQEWPGNEAVINFFINGGTIQKFDEQYKSTVPQRNDLRIFAIRKVITSANTPTQDQLTELAKFVKSNSKEKEIVLTIAAAIDSNIRVSKNFQHIAERLLMAQNLGLFDGVLNACDHSQFKEASKMLFVGIVRAVIADQSKLKETKEMFKKFEHGILPNIIGGDRILAFVYSYLRTQGIDDFLMSLGSGVQTSNGAAILTYYPTEFDFDNGTVKAIMKEYNIGKSTKENVLLGYAAKTGIGYGYGYELNDLIKSTYGDPLNDESLKMIESQFIQIIDMYDGSRAAWVVKAILNFGQSYNKEILTSGLVKKITEFASTKLHSADQEHKMNLLDSLLFSDDRRFDAAVQSILTDVLNSGFEFPQLVRRIKNNRNAVMVNFVRIVYNNSDLRKRVAKAFTASLLDLSKIDMYYNPLYGQMGERNNLWSLLTTNEQDKLLNDLVINISKLNDLYGRKGDVSSILHKIKGDNTHTYKKLSKEAQEAYVSIAKFTGLLTLADDEFYDVMDDETLHKMGYSNLSSNINGLEEDAKGRILTRYFQKQSAREALLNSTGTQNTLELIKINEYTDAFANDIEQALEKNFKYVKDAKRQWECTDLLQSINNKDYKKLSVKHKEMIFKNTLSLIDDADWLKKQTTYFKDKVSDVQQYFDTIVDEDRAGAQKIYDSVSYNMRLRFAESYLSKAGFSKNVEGLLHDNESPITPYQKLDKKRIKEILKYNNVSNAETKVAAKYIKTFDTMDAYIKDNAENDYAKGKLDGQKVELLNQSQEELDKISVELHRNKRNGRHGDTTMKILRSFKVSIPIQEEQQKAWLASHEGEEIINPMFHGTGSIGASMILRYGFRVLKSGDSLVVGRMLGDGIYGSNVIDKAQQYVGDEGFSRRYGTKGYVFKMNAALGEKNKDYRVAGLGTDSIRSPEWCVFTPNAQFKIYHAYEVELIGPTEMNDLLKKYQQVVTEKSFKDYLIEQESEKVNYTTYTFINGIIPNGKNPEDVCDFSEWKSPSDKITLEPSAYGPTIVVAGTIENQDFTFTSTADFRVNYPKEYEKFLKYFN